MYTVVPELKHLEGLIIGECLRCCGTYKHVAMDDVIQVAQIAAMRAISTYKTDKAALSTYVTTVVRRDLCKYVARESNLLNAKCDSCNETDYVSPDYECSADSMLTSLTPQERSIVKLRYGITYRQHDAAEIAELYDMSVSNVNRILFNAIAKIKEQNNVR